MKVICDRGALLDAINLESGVVAARTPRPQLTCVKLTATNEGGVGVLVLSATDAEMSLMVKTERVDVAEPGEALVPADKLRQIVSAEDNEPTLTLETEGDTCHIRGEDAHFRLLGYPSEDFPAIPQFQDVAGGKEGQPRALISLPSGMLATMVTRTLFATARENSRYAINGVLLRRVGKKLEMAATDGRRLAVARGTVQGGDKDAPETTCIIPSKALSMLLKLMDDPEEPVSIALTDNQILFAFGAVDGGEPRAVLTSNLVEGTFPPYEDVIPKDQDKRVVFDRDVLTSGVRRAALLTNEESRGVRLAFKGSERHVELSSRAPEMGEAEIQVEIRKYEGEDLEIGFNPNFLTDALRVIPEPEIILELKSPQKPGLLKAGSDFLYVIMPVNLQ
jgi:DNA polymerase III subunit beta